VRIATNLRRGDLGSAASLPADSGDAVLSKTAAP
jgi:hypothetical protein